VAESAPKSDFRPDPKYSKEALKANYEGVCTLQLIITPEGKPRDVHVVRSLGMGLDEKAIEAVKQWTFEPSMLNGKPVAVAINIEVAFHILKNHH
jgi:periplasmic protein TonB